MGILNLTPDSFYDGNKYFNKENISYEDFNYADIVDIGCESTRPGSLSITLEEELVRLKKIDLDNCFINKKLSIDSTKYNVIEFALENGFKMINDISGGGENNINMTLALKYNVPIVLMHMQGNPMNMQYNPKYKNIIDDLLLFFDKKINFGLKIGLKKEQIIIDPGIGFGKKISDNDLIIRNLGKFKKLGCPILIGISRKSFLCFNNDVPKDRLETSLSVMSLAVNNGADIVRVHDILYTHKVLSIIDRIKYES